MEITSQLELAKEFIKLSILINSDKKFILPDYAKDNKYQVLLYKAISELKRDGIIDINQSSEGGIIITLRK